MRLSFIKPLNEVWMKLVLCRQYADEMLCSNVMVFLKILC